MQATRSVFTYALSTVEALLDAFFETWNRHDMDSCAELFAEEADFVNVVGMHFKGRDTIAAAHKKLRQKRFAHTELRLLQCHLTYLTREIALIHLHWEMTGDAAVPTGFVRRGLMTHVLLRKDGRWYFRATQNADIVHVPEFATDPFWGNYL